jgi:hypothetical protein
MASPVRIIPALPRVVQSTEDRLAEMDSKIDHLIVCIRELLDTTRRISQRLDKAEL